jgi:hypothetical protein
MSLFRSAFILLLLVSARAEAQMGPMVPLIGTGTPWGAPGMAATHVIPPGGMMIAGSPVSCMQAPTILTGPNIGDLAVTTPNGIFINMVAWNQLPPAVQIFSYAHECGHVVQILSNAPINEEGADIFAAQLGKQQGWLDLNGLQQVCALMSGMAGNWTHFPGPIRCEILLQAYPRL